MVDDLALVTPHFSYCDTVRGGPSRKLSNDLQKAGNFAAKSLLGLKKKDSPTEALLRLNMMPLEHKRTVHLGVMVHKLHNHTGPKQMVDNYRSLMERAHRYPTRSSTRGDMTSLQHNSSRFERSTLQRAIRTWNAIPLDIRNIDSTATFKRNFQAHLLASYKEDARTM